MFETDDGAPRIFRLYPTCKPVRGDAFSAVYDLDRRRVLRFDSAYFALFEAAARREGIALEDVEQLDPQPREHALGALQVMLDLEVGQFFDPVAAACLVDVPIQWDVPRTIINSIVDVDATEPDWEPILTELVALRCRAIQIRCFSSLMSPTRVLHLLEKFRGSPLAHVEFVVEWSSDWETMAWDELFATYQNLLAVRVHSAPADRDITRETLPVMVGRIVQFRTAAIDGPACCGTISHGSLSIPSAALFSELSGFNGCLNRKISFRASGEICNCPSLKASYGTDLSRCREIVASPEFQRVWSIRKDDIEVCKRCEFRYVCTDCRAYLGSDSSLAKPLKCSYDPSIGQWQQR